MSWEHWGLLGCAGISWHMLMHKGVQGCPGISCDILALAGISWDVLG